MQAHRRSRARARPHGADRATGRGAIVAVAALAGVLALALSISRGDQASRSGLQLTFRVEPAGAAAAQGAAQVMRARLSAAAIADARVAVASNASLTITAPASAHADVTALVQRGHVAISDWERSVLGPRPGSPGRASGAQALVRARRRSRPDRRRHRERRRGDRPGDRGPDRHDRVHRTRAAGLHRAHAHPRPPRTCPGGQRSRRQRGAPALRHRDRRSTRRGAVHRLPRGAGRHRRRDRRPDPGRPAAAGGSPGRGDSGHGTTARRALEQHREPPPRQGDREMTRHQTQRR